MKDKKKLIITASVVIVAIVIGAVRVITSTQTKYKEVDIGKVETRNLSRTISVTGNIEAAAKEEITLPTQQKVTNIFVREGQDVAAGEAILKIDTTDYEYQLKKYGLALELADTNLQRLLTTGSKSDREALENAVRQAEINYSSAEANYSEAKRKFDQSQVLYNTGAISKEEYEASRKALSDLKNAMELAQIQLDNANNSLRDFGANNSDQIKQQRNQVESAKADIANIKDKIEQCTIKSSINGKVVQLDVQENQYPTMENNIIRIYDLSSYKVKVAVSQYDAPGINLGQKAAIRLKGIDKEYTGTVASIGEAAVMSMDGTNKEPKIEIEIVIDDADDKIKVGFEADADITLKESPDTLSVGFDSVLEDTDGKKYVFAVENGKAVKRYVTTGLETDFDIQITEGLKEGEQYVKNPPSTLKDGDPVKQSGGKKQ